MMSSFSQSPLIRYLSNLQVMRTGIKVQIWAAGLDYSLWSYLPLSAEFLFPLDL